MKYTVKLQQFNVIRKVVYCAKSCKCDAYTNHNVNTNGVHSVRQNAQENELNLFGRLFAE